MNNEIKEILDKAKEISYYGADGKQHTRMFNQFEAKILLDYITNLQEELENLKDFNNKLQATKDRLDKYDRENQLKIDKAIEYINHEIFKRTILVGVGTKKYTKNILDNILNILQGSDKE